MGAALRSLALRAPLPAGVIALWRFSRPHTLVGTAVSILGIYAIAAAELPAIALGDGLPDLALTLLAGAAVNVYIVGLNQCEDVELDRLNKPWLPIPAGELSLARARLIVTGSGALALALAVTQGWVEIAAVLAAMAIGTAYSTPPLHLKRRPALAAASITIVRAAVVNIGVYEHFAASLGGRPELSGLPGPIVALMLFVLPFSFAIAVLKDVPDVRGDRQFSIATFTVRLGPRRAFAIGLGALVAAYLGMAAIGPIALHDVQPLVLAGGQIAALGVLCRGALATDPRDAEGFPRFYMLVWALFILQYALVPVAVLAA
jgi:homogentisate phytyltransferase / homogentisate geranylgeranyltransferase